MTPARWLVAFVVLALLGGAWLVMRGSDTEPIAPVGAATDPESRGEPETRTGRPVVGDDGPGERQDAPRPERDESAAPEPAEESTPSVARVRGRVVDVRGAGIAGARIAAIAEDDEVPVVELVGLSEVTELAADEVATGDDGWFEIGLASLGAFRLVATHDQHPRAECRGEAAGALVEGIVITMRDGAVIAGRVVGAPVDAGPLVLVAKKVDASVASDDAGGVVDFGDLLEGIGLPIGGKSAAIEEDRTFRIGGLDPDATYEVRAAKTSGEDRPLVQCTSRVSVRAGARGVELVWQEPLTVGFRVVDAASGQPLEELRVSAGYVRHIEMFGMKVPVAPKHPLPRTEFDDGVVVVDGLGTREGQTAVALGVRAHGYREWSRDEVQLPAAGHVDLGVVRLERAPVVRVRVIAQDGGDPVAGAEVTLAEAPDESADDGERSLTIGASVEADADTSAGIEIDTGDGSSPMTAETDADGFCELTAQFDGEAVLRVEADAWAPRTSERFVVPALGTLEREVSLYAGGTAVVRVVDVRGTAIAGAFVDRRGPDSDADREKQRCGDDGVVRFERLAPGVHRFRLVDEVRADRSGIAIDIGAAANPDEEHTRELRVVDRQIAELELVKPARGRVHGVVTLDGEALDGADIRVARAGAESEDEAVRALGAMLGGLMGVAQDGVTQTGPDGGFEIGNVLVGSRRLEIRHRDLAMPASFAVEVVEGDSPCGELTIRSTLVSGRVVGADGAPISDVRIRARVVHADAEFGAKLAEAEEQIAAMFGGALSGPETRTAADGSFTLRGVRHGVPVVIQATAKRHVAASTRVEALAEGGRRAGVVLMMQAAGRVHVSALGIDGALAATARWVGDGDRPDEKTAVLKRSRATIDGLLPGRWRIELDGELRAPVEPRVVDVAAGETVRVDFD